MECIGIYNCPARSQPVFSGGPEVPFCLSCTFIFQNERNWIKKSARVSEKLVSPGLPGLQVATRLVVICIVGPYIRLYALYQAQLVNCVLIIDRRFFTTESFFLI